MSKIPIVFTFDNRIILGAAAAIKSLIDSAKADTIYDIHILHNGIEEKYQKMRVNCRNMAEKKCSKEALVNKVLEFIK